MPIRWNKLLFVLFILVVNISFSQEKNPTVYPYGGVPDGSRFEGWMERIPLNFKTANFDSAQFDSSANFWIAEFHSMASFREIHFDSLADFLGVKFNSQAYFSGTQFHSRANFFGANFHSRADFFRVEFDKLADFRQAQFDSLAFFIGAKFHSQADFFGAYFHSLADFRMAEFDSLAEADFNSAEILDSVYVGSAVNIQRFDFSLAKLLANAKIIIYDPIEIKIQHEKFNFISLPMDKDYFSKKVIIDGTKKESFKGDNYAKERFELDYIFARSTMYQDKSANYIENRWYHFWKYPKWFLNTLYYITMGLGYRPFRLAWWVLGFVILFTFVYYLWMPGQINKYIAKSDERKTIERSRRKRTRRTAHPHFTDTILNCFYFSSMMFFTFRLKRDILTFFSTKEKRVVVGEWLIGLIIYISFLTLSKSGSILHTLKSLFVG